MSFENRVLLTAIIPSILVVGAAILGVSDAEQVRAARQKQREFTGRVCVETVTQLREQRDGKLVYTVDCARWADAPVEK